MGNRISLVCNGLRAARQNLAEDIYLRSGIDFTRPTSIRAYLTERCNYRCVYCRHWRQDEYADEMTLPEWQQCLQSLRNYVGRYTVQFLGGEPMLRRDLYPLFAYCRNIGVDWGIITNGFALNDEVARLLMDARPLNVDVSIDSITPAIHDELRGVRGSLSRISAGLRHLLHHRQRSGAGTIIRIKSTITRRNYRGMIDLVEHVAELPGVIVDFSPVRLWRQDEIDQLYVADEAELVELGDIVGRLSQMKTEGAPIETSVEKLNAIVPHFRDERNFHAFRECRVGLRAIEIRPDGEVRHCSEIPEIGNARHTDARDIWEGAKRTAALPKTITCEQAGTGSCATACTSHRTLRQEVQRGMLMLTRS